MIIFSFIVLLTMIIFTFILLLTMTIFVLYFVTNHDYFLITMIVMILYQVASGLAGNALARFVRYEYILYMT